MDYLQRQARLVTAVVLAWSWPGRSQHVVFAWLQSLTDGARRACVAGVMATLLALAVPAASFGPVELGIYFLTVVILVK